MMMQGRTQKKIWCPGSHKTGGSFESSAFGGQPGCRHKVQCDDWPKVIQPGLGLTPSGLILRAWAWSTARLQPTVLEEQGDGA